MNRIMQNRLSLIKHALEICYLNTSWLLWQNIMDQSICNGCFYDPVMSEKCIGIFYLILS